MPRPKLKLYLDVVSPFGYMAFYMTRNSPIFKQCDITYIPIFLGGLMQACNNTPPIKVKNKDKYISADRTRLAHLLSIPITAELPSPFPQNTLTAQRALCTIQSQSPEKLAASFEALYKTFWLEGKAIGEMEVVVEALAGVLGGEEEARRVVEGTKEERVKGLLSGNTMRAFEAGAFGVPFWVVQVGKGRDEVFFGVDRVGMVVDALGLDRGEGFRALL